MRKRRFKAVLFTAAIVMGITFTPVKAMSGLKSKPDQTSPILRIAAQRSAPEETVYVSQDADGSVTEIRVDTGAEDDENETIEVAEHSRLPVGVAVSYRLNGVDIAPEALAGQSGEVEIILHYSNHSTYVDVLDGEKVQMNSPFFMLSALIMEEETFSDIRVSQGKLITEGDTQIVIAYSMPGLTKNLNLTGEVKDDFEEKFSDTVTITAMVTEFSMKPIYTIATTELLSEMDFEDTKSLDELEEALDEMVEASDELISGSSTLQGALSTLDKNFSAYTSGIEGLKKGSKTLADGTKQFAKGFTAYAGAIKTLKQGTNQYISGTLSLADGITAYINGEKAIDSAAGELYEKTKALPAGYVDFHNGLTAYIDNVNKLAGKENIDMLTEGADSIAKGANTVDSMTDSLTQSYNESYAAFSEIYDSIKDSLSPEEQDRYQAALSKLNNATNGTGEGASLKNVQKAAQGLKAGTEQFNSAVSIWEQGAATIQTSGEAVKTGSENIKSSVTAVVDGIKGLSEGLATLSANNQTLTEGAANLKKSGSSLKTGFQELNKSTKQLTKSASALKSGAKELASGAGSIYKATPQLAEGISALASGSRSLTSGLKTFKEEGTLKLRNMYRENVKSLIDRLKSISGEQAKYGSFIDDGDEDASVKFIFQTEEIKAEQK
ncbi:MAG: hypothetical protein K2G89_03775 [Lachnospiraceae bacterium]|nr:hypothetical protein [Lachnospiraceae bacterium]